MNWIPLPSTIVQLRRWIAFLWLYFYAFALLLIILRPTLSNYQGIERDQIPNVLIQVSGIWMPPLSCFFGFWFPMTDSEAIATAQSRKDRAAFAILITVLFNAVITWLLFELLYLERRAMNLETGLPYDKLGLDERVNQIVKYALLSSPLALVPVTYLTSRGKESPGIRRTSPTKSKPKKEP
ncbi:MAG: hypothetical protein ACJ8C4_15155 [Gemmataceae bacterium]